jgi:hypothetical protein
MAFALAVRRLRGTPIPSTPEIYVLDRVLSGRASSLGHALAIDFIERCATVETIVRADVTVCGMPKIVFFQAAERPHVYAGR